MHMPHAFKLHIYICTKKVPLLVLVNIPVPAHVKEERFESFFDITFYCELACKLSAEILCHPFSELFNFIRGRSKIVSTVFNVINNEESPMSIKDLIEHRNNKIKTH